jgi:hypothetical protein
MLNGVNKMSDEVKYTSIAVAIIAVIVILFIGPNRIARYWASYKADAYGSDWLVVKEDMSGNTIRYWELNDKSVGSEDGSDGIYFIDEGGDVVHLSGFYTYVQVNGGFEQAKKKYLKGAK